MGHRQNSSLPIGTDNNRAGSSVEWPDRRVAIPGVLGGIDDVGVVVGRWLSCGGTGSGADRVRPGTIRAERAEAGGSGHARVEPVVVTIVRLLVVGGLVGVRRRAAASASRAWDVRRSFGKRLKAGRRVRPAVRRVLPVRLGCDVRERIYIGGDEVEGWRNRREHPCRRRCARCRPLLTDDAVTGRGLEIDSRVVRRHWVPPWGAAVLAAHRRREFPALVAGPGRGGGRAAGGQQ